MTFPPAPPTPVVTATMPLSNTRSARFHSSGAILVLSGTQETKRLTSTSGGLVRGGAQPRTRSAAPGGAANEVRAGELGSLNERATIANGVGEPAGAGGGLRQGGERFRPENDAAAGVAPDRG